MRWRVICDLDRSGFGQSGSLIGENGWLDIGVRSLKNFLKELCNKGLERNEAIKK